MAKERRDQPVIWDDLVSASVRRLASKTLPDARHSKLSITTTPIVRHLPTVRREAGMIDMKIRGWIRKASTDGIRWPLVLSGAPGVGKTCSGLCVVDHVPDGEWWAWGDFWRFVLDVNMGKRVNDLRKGRRTEEGWFEPSARVKWTTAGLWKWFAGLPLVVLDDVGVSDGKAAQRETMTTALDRREGRPFIITSNLDIDALGEAFDARVMDRLSAGTVVEMFGKDAKSMR